MAPPASATERDRRPATGDRRPATGDRELALAAGRPVPTACLLPIQSS
jgi:hypothetical protein